MQSPPRVRAIAIVGALAVVLLVGGIALAIWSGRLAGPRATEEPIGSTVPAGTMPALKHAWLIVLENHSLVDVRQTGAMPYLQQLIARGGLATNYSAVARPSQPNYIALFSGSTQGVDDDNVHNLSAPNFADQLEQAGRTWAVWAENLPADGCFTGATASGGPDGPGKYARKHEPAISFRQISGNPLRCARIRPLSAFDPGAADFQLIVPNLCHDAHDCALSSADDFLAGFVPRILDSTAFSDGGALFITFDEGSKDHGQTVPLVVVSPFVRAGSTTDQDHNHYSLLRTLEDSWHLDCLARACSSTDLSELFATRPGASPSP